MSRGFFWSHFPDEATEAANDKVTQVTQLENSPARIHTQLDSLVSRAAPEETAKEGGDNLFG